MGRTRYLVLPINILKINFLPIINMYGNPSMKRKIGILLLLISGIFLFTGCIFQELSPLPDSERYKRINEVVDSLEIDEAGKITFQKYDTGDGVFSPSFVYFQIEGKYSFKNLTRKLQSVPEIECSLIIETQVKCSVKQVNIEITRDDKKVNSLTHLKIIDITNGKK